MEHEHSLDVSIRLDKRESRQKVFNIFGKEKSLIFAIKPTNCYSFAKLIYNDILLYIL